MTECECIPGCPFFNDRMLNMPSLSKMYKKNYCLGNYDACARHMVFKALGKESVPSDLFPNQSDIAETLINQKV